MDGCSGDILSCDLIIPQNLLLRVKVVEITSIFFLWHAHKFLPRHHCPGRTIDDAVIHMMLPGSPPPFRSYLSRIEEEIRE